MVRTNYILDTLEINMRERLFIFNCQSLSYRYEARTLRWQYSNKCTEHQSSCNRYLATRTMRKYHVDRTSLMLRRVAKLSSLDTRFQKSDNIPSVGLISF